VSPGERRARLEEAMGVVAAVLLLALIFGGIGLFVTAAKWALIVAGVLLVAGAVAGAVTVQRARR
jgi:hypothetical protein